MTSVLALHWQRVILVSGSLLALGACETMTAPEPPQDAAAAIVDRSPRVASEIARGREALVAGDLSSARSAFTAALRGSPNDPEPAIGLAETYLAMGDLETAGRVFDIVASAEGGAADARLLQGRGLVALGQGRTDEAIGLLEESVDSDPTQWRAWAGLGRAYGRKGNSRQARSAFDRAEENAPSPAVVMNDVGMLHLEANDAAAALEAFQRALAVDPGNAVASANARIARAMLGEYDAAISGARPEELPDVLNNVGYVAVVNGDFDVADRLLRRAIEISPVYHQAARANLDLLAQAMKGDPALALPGPEAADPRIAANAEPPSVATSPIEDRVTVPASAGSAGPIATDAWGAGPLGPAVEPREAAPTLARLATPPLELASVPAIAPAPDTAPGVMAHGFRWESQPLSAAPAKKRAKRRAAKPTTPDAADPRGTAWPAISVPPVESAAERRPEGAQEPSDQALAEDPGEPVVVEQAQSGEVETGEAVPGEAVAVGEQAPARPPEAVSPAVAASGETPLPE